MNSAGGDKPLCGAEREIALGPSQQRVPFRRNGGDRSQLRQYFVKDLTGMAQIASPLYPTDTVDAGDPSTCGRHVRINGVHA